MRLVAGKTCGKCGKITSNENPNNNHEVVRKNQAKRYGKHLCNECIEKLVKNQ